MYLGGEFLISEIVGPCDNFMLHFFVWGVADEIQDVMHSRQTLYHWSISLDISLVF